MDKKADYPPAQGGVGSSFHFSKGLYGLEQYKNFHLLWLDEHLPFAYLQAEEEEGIRLLVADPFAFYSSYRVELMEEELSELGNPTQEDLIVVVTVSARSSLAQATANLLAPIVLNRKKGLGRQVILHNSKYQIKTPLFSSPKGGEPFARSQTENR